MAPDADADADANTDADTDPNTDTDTDTSSEAGTDTSTETGATASVRAGRTAGPVADVVDLDHVALRVADLDRALGFYHDLLGLPTRDCDRYDRGDVPYVAVVAGGRHLHLVPDETFDDADADVGGEHICLLLRSAEVDSRAELERVLDDLDASGVEIEADEPIERYGAYGRAWAAYVRDPDGRRVELKMH